MAGVSTPQRPASGKPTHRALGVDWDSGYIRRMTKMTVTVSAMSVFILVLTTQYPSSGQPKAPKTNPKLLLTECAQDGFEVWVPYSAKREKVAQVDDLELDAGFPSSTEGPTFWFVRGKQEIFQASVDEMYSAAVWIAIEHRLGLSTTTNQARIAITYWGEGGPIGGALVRVFLVDGNGVKEVSRSIGAAVANFKTRHYCEARGNTVSALKWIRGNLLLLTQVYPTGDCGPDLGHMEGYLVSVPEGKILEHMKVNQLKHHPGVCLENDAQN